MATATAVLSTGGLLGILEHQAHGGGLHRDASILLILPGVGVTWALGRGSNEALEGTVRQSAGRRISLPTFQSFSCVFSTRRSMKVVLPWCMAPRKQTLPWSLGPGAGQRSRSRSQERQVQAATDQIGLVHHGSKEVKVEGGVWHLLFQKILTEALVSAAK